MAIPLPTNGQVKMDDDFKHWFADQKWKEGFSAQPFPAINQKEFYKQYQGYTNGWKKAFEYLAKTDLSQVLPGTYELDGRDVYVSVTTGATKPLYKTAWEAHQKYIDIQYVVQGTEKIGVAPLTSAKLEKQYDSVKDVANYDTNGTYYTADKHIFFIFFPTDVHRPSVRSEQDSTVKKVVIKVKVAGS